VKKLTNKPDAEFVRKPMIAVVPDSFKGTLSAVEATEAIRQGFKKGFPGARLRLIPMADGGEGTVDALAKSCRASIQEITTIDPLGRPITASYALNKKRRLAVVEMAAASGLMLLAPEELNPLKTSTYGAGLLLRHAIENGARKVILGIGGSATNDGGAGLASALGVKFLDVNSCELPPGGEALKRLSRIDVSNIDPQLKDVELLVACDVDNPLFGPNGAAAVYSPQKGATPEMVRSLDKSMKHFAEICSEQLNSNYADYPGAGAAGGLGFGLLTFCGATLCSGVEIIAETIDLRERLKDCDLVITGEGRIDGQSLSGKTPVGVAKIAKSLQIPVIAISGALGENYGKLHSVGVSAIFPAAHGDIDPGNLSSGAFERLSATAEQIARLLYAGQLRS
jgi:glycerate kinase